MALPFGAPAHAAPAPAAPATAKAASQADVGTPVIKVQRAQRGGGMRGSGFRGRGPGMGSRGFRGRGPGINRSFRGRGAGYRRGAGRRHWAGRPGHRHRHWRGRRGGIYFGAPYYYGAWGPSYYYDDPVVSYDDDAVARCAARYRSFDPASGTFLHVSGERRLCPYLR